MMEERKMKKVKSNTLVKVKDLIIFELKNQSLIFLFK